MTDGEVGQLFLFWERLKWKKASIRKIREVSSPLNFVVILVFECSLRQQLKELSNSGKGGAKSFLWC